MLAMLAIFDLVYILTMLTESLTILESGLETDIYKHMFPIILYPLNHITMTGNLLFVIWLFQLIFQVLYLQQLQLQWRDSLQPIILIIIIKLSRNESIIRILTLTI